MGGEALAYEVLQRAGAPLDEPPSVAALVRALGLTVHYGASLPGDAALVRERPAAVAHADALPANLFWSVHSIRSPRSTGRKYFDRSRLQSSDFVSSLTTSVSRCRGITGVIMPTISERVRRARIKAGLTQRGLARLAGLSASAVAVIERRTGSVSATTAFALARVLGVSPEWLVTGSGKRAA